MQIMVGVPISLIYILQALAILFAIAGAAVNISGRFARPK